MHERRVSRAGRGTIIEIDWEGRQIWGATAAMIVNLSRRLESASEAGPRMPCSSGRASSGCSNALGARQGTARFVGGAVRDLLLGRTGQATSISPPSCSRTRSCAGSKRRGIKAVPTGIEHGTVTAVSSGTVVEITTLAVRRLDRRPPGDGGIHRRLGGGRRRGAISPSMRSTPIPVTANCSTISAGSTT